MITSTSPWFAKILKASTSGLEHEVAPGVVESLKVITGAASIRIAESAFYYAAMQNRRKVSAIHKANIIERL